MSSATTACSSSAARPMSTTTFVGVELRPLERGVDDVRRAVQPLRRPEHLAAEAVGDHHVISHGHAEHGLPPVVGDRVAERRQTAGGQPRHHVRQLAEARLPGDERVEGRVPQQLECQSSRSAVVRRPLRARREGADLARADAEAT